VSGSVYGAGDLGPLADEAADHEEAGANIVAREDLKQSHCGGVVGAVVVGEGDLGGVSASNDGAPEEL
jgi:hypothetical protein